MTLGATFISVVYQTFITLWLQRFSNINDEVLGIHFWSVIFNNYACNLICEHGVLASVTRFEIVGINPLVRLQLIYSISNGKEQSAGITRPPTQHCAAYAAPPTEPCIGELHLLM
jgi:hypothetical protein